MRHSAFTLIELLVVLAIITLLLSILTPSLQLAREQARTAACAASLHDVGVAVTVYSGANGQYGPVAAHRPDPLGDPHEWQYQRSWVCHLSSITEGEELVNAQACKDAWADPSGRVPPGRSVLWGCPEFTNAYDECAAKYGEAQVWFYEDSADRWAKTGYAMNVYMHRPDSSDWNTYETDASGQSVRAGSGGVWPSAGYTRLTTWTGPSSRPLIADHHDMFIHEHTVSGNAPDTFLSRRHPDERAGVLYVDGHAGARLVGVDLWDAFFHP
jgi:prepilin-type N-terminal cleavage/methylation domain-containing protein/prepilin-type processing-associated H-X9-DG protein